MVAADRTIHLISGTCKCQFIGETFRLSAARLDRSIRDKDRKQDDIIETHVDNRAG